MPDPRPTRTRPPASGRSASGTAERQREIQGRGQRPERARARRADLRPRRFRSIAPEDLRGRLRWWGLYTQRKPGIDGGCTPACLPKNSTTSTSCCASRTDGGMLSVEQLRTIAQISQRFGRDTADITDRQNIQLHWIRIEDMPQIWQMLEARRTRRRPRHVGTPRVVLSSPVAGIAADEIIDGTPAIEEIVRRYVGDPEYANLPRKFKRRSPVPHVRTWPTRSTACPSSESSILSSVRASTCGWAGPVDQSHGGPAPRRLGCTR